MTVSETWEDFESALTSVLLDLEEREMITIKLAGGEIPFIQFAGLGSLNGVDGLQAEFSAENVKGDRGASTTFAPEQRSFFTQSGFAVAKEGLVWRREYPWPTPSRTIRNVARACVIRLRDIGDVDSPERLIYKAWSYPDYRDEIPEEERSVGTDELDLLSLGLQREHT